jgi:hypothetical protein
VSGGEEGEIGDPDRTRAEKRAFLREIADEIRADPGESQQVAAILYRVSDIYDPGEDTEPRDVYVDMKNILRVKAQGGKPDPEGT